jgi:hypothetical protein
MSMVKLLFRHQKWQVESRAAGGKLWQFGVWALFGRSLAAVLGAASGVCCRNALSVLSLPYSRYSTVMKQGAEHPAAVPIENQWGIHWKSPTLVLVFYTVSVVAALSHHLLYSSLDGSRAHDQDVRSDCPMCPSVSFAQSNF